MLDNIVRKHFAKYSKAIIQNLILWKVSPKHITLAGFALALIATYFIATNHTYIAIVFWWLNRLLDGLDGILARETKQQTTFGGYLDILLDMASYKYLSIKNIGFSHACCSLNSPFQRG